MADDDRRDGSGAESGAEGLADPAVRPPDEDQAAPAQVKKGRKPRRKHRASENKAKQEEPLRPEQVADALALLSSYFHEKKRTYAEIDEQLGKRPGYTGKILHGKRPFDPETVRAIRQLLGIREEQYKLDMARREAVREFRARTGSLIPSPHQRKARHPRRQPGRRTGPEPEEPPDALFEPEILAMLDQMEDGLWAALGLERPTEPPRRPRGGAKRGRAKKDPTEPPRS